MRIKSFVINTNKKSITLNFINGDTACLDFEYLRVFTPSQQKSANQQTLVTNKKLVLLNAIENVGKHGFRLVFDDQHSAIYSNEYITQLSSEHDHRWQRYLTELKAAGHSREAIINITQL